MRTFQSFVTSGRITPVSGNASVKLSSAEVFRRADSDADGFLDNEKFTVAMKLVRPQADANEMAMCNYQISHSHFPQQID